MTKRDMETIVAFVKVIAVCIFPNAKCDPKKYIGQIDIQQKQHNIGNDFQYKMKVTYADSWRKYVEGN